MIVSFTVDNFLSFKGRHTLDFLPEPLKEHVEFLHPPYIYDRNYRLLKSLAIYGHNGGGKSNLMKAYAFFRNTIFQSFTIGSAEGYLSVDYFKLNTANKLKPAYFETIFIISEIRYRYSFSILDGKVVQESLWYAEPKIRENYLFERVANDFVLSKSWTRESEKIKNSISFTKSHHLFLSVLFAQEDIPRIETIRQWLYGNLIFTDITAEQQLKQALLILHHHRYRPYIQKFIEVSDIGFTTIVDKVDSITDQKLKLDKDFVRFLFEYELQQFELYSQHSVYDEYDKWVGQISFELLKSESSGSIKYLILSCFMAYALMNGQVIWVDELDAKLHSLLLKKLLKIFNGKINNTGSQLVYSLHNTSTLDSDMIRRDQVFFVTKNDHGVSTLSRMHSAKNPLRRELSFEKYYLTGKMEAGISKKLLNNQMDLFANPPYQADK